MDAAIDILRVFNVLTAGVLAGGQLFCYVAVLPALAGWTQEMSSVVHRDMLTDRPHRFLRVQAIASVLSGVALLVLMIVDDDRPLAIGILAAGVVAAAISSAISSREWPINEEIKSWHDEPKLERYAELRRIWDDRHVRRTVLSTIALVAFATAIVVSRAG